MSQRRLGQKVRGLLPGEPGYGSSGRLSAAEAEPLSHRAIWFMLEDEGHWVKFGMLRSVQWLAAAGVGEVGSRVQFDLAEMGVVGEAQVMAIEPCPPIDPGPGELVISVFQHSEGQIWEVQVECDSRLIGTTESHPFWSVDRNAFVPACELQEGEWLRGEAGPVQVLGVKDTGRLEPVYNIEVEGDHCYRVGEQGILVHNASAVFTIAGNQTPTE